MVKSGEKTKKGGEIKVFFLLLLSMNRTRRGGGGMSVGMRVKEHPWPGKEKEK